MLRQCATLTNLLTLRTTPTIGNTMHATQQIDKFTFDHIDMQIRDIKCEYHAMQCVMISSIRLFDVESKYYACDACREHYANVCETCCDDDDDDDYSCNVCNETNERALKCFDDALSSLINERRKRVVNDMMR